MEKRWARGCAVALAVVLAGCGDADQSVATSTDAVEQVESSTTSVAVSVAVESSTTPPVQEEPSSTPPAAIASIDSDAAAAFDAYDQDREAYMRWMRYGADSTTSEADDVVAHFDPSLLREATVGVPGQLHLCMSATAPITVEDFEFPEFELVAEHVEQHEISATVSALEVRHSAVVDGETAGSTTEFYLVTEDGIGPVVSGNDGFDDCAIPWTEEAEALRTEAQLLLDVEPVDTEAS